MSLGWFAIAVLGVWRVTHLLVAEDGPGDLVVRFRAAAGEGFWGALLDCVYCASVWIAVPFAIGIGNTWGERALCWPALSAAAILIERMTSRDSPAPALYVEHTDALEDHHVLLRK